VKKLIPILLSLAFLMALFGGNALATTEYPCIDIEKEVSVDDGETWHDADSEELAPTTGIGQGVEYRLIVTNCGNVDLVNVTITDDDLGIDYFYAGPLAPGESIVLDGGVIDQLYQPERCDEPGTVENVASVVADVANPGGTVTDDDPAWVECSRGNEGCTPGYWKQPQHEDSWEGYYPKDLFVEIFGEVITIRWKEKKGKPVPTEDPTLLQALQARGGGINALARHAVAALLNASNPAVLYYYSVDEVIQMTQDALGSGSYGPTKNLFEEANEAGCPLN